MTITDQSNKVIFNDRFLTGLNCLNDTITFNRMPGPRAPVIPKMPYKLRIWYSPDFRNETQHTTNETEKIRVYATIAKRFQPRIQKSVSIEDSQSPIAQLPVLKELYSLLKKQQKEIVQQNPTSELLDSMKSTLQEQLKELKESLCVEDLEKVLAESIQRLRSKIQSIVSKSERIILSSQIKEFENELKNTRHEKAIEEYEKNVQKEKLLVHLVKALLLQIKEIKGKQDSKHMKFWKKEVREKENAL